MNKALDRVRQFLGRDLGLIPDGAHNLSWVTDFPMFEWNEGEGRLEALHHPFTAPNPDDLRAAGGDLRAARAVAYDLVYNGVEVGGGSLRIYRCVCVRGRAGGRVRCGGALAEVWSSSAVHQGMRILLCG